MTLCPILSCPVMSCPDMSQERFNEGRARRLDTRPRSATVHAGRLEGESVAVKILINHSTIGTHILSKTGT